MPRLHPANPNYIDQVAWLNKVRTHQKILSFHLPCRLASAAWNFIPSQRQNLLAHSASSAKSPTFRINLPSYFAPSTFEKSYQNLCWTSKQNDLQFSMIFMSTVICAFEKDGSIYKYSTCHTSPNKYIYYKLPCILRIYFVWFFIHICIYIWSQYHRETLQTSPQIKATMPVKGKPRSRTFLTATIRTISWRLCKAVILGKGDLLPQVHGGFPRRGVYPP